MSSTVDVNVLVYASATSSVFHSKAAELLERLAQGPEPFYLFWPVIMGYLRVTTHPAVFAEPLAPKAAAENISRLLAFPYTRTAAEGDDFWNVYETATSGMVVSGNLVPDAHLVALIRENGVGTLWTHDRDFRKFEGIRVRDPFA